MISVVIPTYNEAVVIQETLERAAAALQATGEAFELIVVDDASADGTAEVAEAMGSQLPVRVLRRPGKLGLTTAVVSGWAIARGDVLGVMDADLQHPPETLGRLVAALRAGDADLAVASRYVTGGGTAGWSAVRRFVSRAGVRLGAVVLPWTLGDVEDSGSGMFMVRAEVLEGIQLSPIGIKTLLEVLSKAKYGKLVEVPYVFQRRTRGESKLGARQYWEYLVHLWRVGRSTGELAMWFRFLLVGLGGALVNLLALYFLAVRGGWSLAFSLLVAIQLALLVNFFGHEAWTFRTVSSSEPRQRGFVARLLSFEGTCLVDAVLNGVVTYFLSTRGFGLLLAAIAGIITGSCFHLLFDIPPIWRIWKTRRPQVT